MLLQSAQDPSPRSRRTDRSSISYQEERRRSKAPRLLFTQRRRIGVLGSTPHLPPTWTVVRCLASGSASRKTSWVTGAASPSPKRRKRITYTIESPSAHPKKQCGTLLWCRGGREECSDGIRHHGALETATRTG